MVAIAVSDLSWFEKGEVALKLQIADQGLSLQVWSEYVRISVKQVWVIPAAIVCMLLFASAPELWSAALLASLRGSVRDRAGVPITEATVRAKNVATGRDRAVSSNREGRFEFPQLTAGTYILQASRDGFVSQVQEGLELEAGQLVILAFVLEQSTGAQEQASQETGEAAAAPSSTNRIDESQLVGLPLNGRSYSQLATLQAGVSDPSATSGSRGVGGGGLTVAGGRSTSNVFLLDGTNIMDARNQVPRSAAGVQLGSDAVFEVQVFSTNYGAEYGRGSGGILNSITKSGTPEFHGTFFEFLRNSKLDARNFFDPADEPIPPFKRNQFGFTLTGPVVKDRTFIMGSFEGLRDRLSATNVDFFPDEQARRGQ